MIVDLVPGIHVRELLALHWCVIGTVVEPVALPGSTRELRPFNMVLCQLSCLQVNHEDLLPVAATARDGVGSIFAVVREIHTLQGHSAVSTQLVGIEEHAWLTAQLVHHIHHALVLQTVVLVKIPLAVTLARRRDPFIVRQFRQSLQQLPTEGNLR